MRLLAQAKNFREIEEDSRHPGRDRDSQSDHLLQAVRRWGNLTTFRGNALPRLGRSRQCHPDRSGARFP